MAAFLGLKAGRHCRYALLEVDVTAAKQLIECGYGLDEDETLNANDTEPAAIRTESAPA